MADSPNRPLPAFMLEMIIKGVLTPSPAVAIAMAREILKARGYANPDLL
jgi:hypothetical protein